MLTDDEIVRLIAIGVERLGITDRPLTGGEPLLRATWSGWWPASPRSTRARRSR